MKKPMVKLSTIIVKLSDGKLYQLKTEDGTMAGVLEYIIEREGNLKIIDRPLTTIDLLQP